MPRLSLTLTDVAQVKVDLLRIHPALTQHCLFVRVHPAPTHSLVISTGCEAPTVLPAAASVSGSAPLFVSVPVSNSIKVRVTLRLGQKFQRHGWPPPLPGAAILRLLLLVLVRDYAHRR